MSWNPTPEWCTGWANRWDLVKAPLLVLEHWFSPLFLGSTLYAFTLFTTYMHTKSALGTAIVAVILAPPLAILPELRWLAFFSLIFGVAATLWEFARRWVVAR